MERNIEVAHPEIEVGLPMAMAVGMGATPRPNVTS
jgi:hypothetical protein